MASSSAPADGDDHTRREDEDDDVHRVAVFLSHSGQQKPFVRRLYRALYDAGLINTFLDEQSLRPAELYPDDLRRNATRCRLGVVVLSPGFLMSKWPMLELQLFKESPFHPLILPLFYEIQPKDVKRSSDRFSEWQAEWEQIADKDDSIDTSKWEEYTTSLATISGVEYKVNEDDEHRYIEKVRQKICTIVCPPLQYDNKLLKGREYFVKEIAASFDKIQSETLEQQHSAPSIIGLHAPEGNGKSTLCKLMANYYMGLHAGRSTVIELPYDRSNNTRTEVLEKCKAALHRLSDVEEALVRIIDDLDQIPYLIGHHVRRYDVFFAIDNVSEQTLEYASKILDSAFSTGSKILVTSRNRETLLTLLTTHAKNRVQPLPTVASSFRHLPDVDKEILLDVALMYVPMYVSDRRHLYGSRVEWAKDDGMSRFDHLAQWLTVSNKGKFDAEPDVRTILKHLAENGFLKFQAISGPEGQQDMKICLQDEFCASNFSHAQSSRCVFLSMDEILGRRVENIQWGEVESLALSFDINELDDACVLQQYIDTVINDSEQGRIPKLRILWIDVAAARLDLPSVNLRLRTDDTPALRVLVLRGCAVDTPLEINGTCNLGWLEITSYHVVGEEDLQVTLTRKHMRALHFADVVQSKTGRCPSFIKSACANGCIIESLTVVA